MYSFNYHKPDNIQTAREMMRSAEDGIYLAGGQTLIPVMKQRLSAPTDLIDLSGIGALTDIAVANGQVTVGALTNHAQVAISTHVKDAIPALADLAAGIGDAQVRNRGTLGGSIANNDPAADYPAALLGLGALVQTDQRQIAADDFFVGLFETRLEEGEIVTSVSFPVPDMAAYLKFPNPASRYATVGVFIGVKEGLTRVAVTGAASCVFRAAEIEAALNTDFSVASVDGIAIAADDLNSDIHASAEYRAHLVSVMTKRVVHHMRE
jgi:carbon-monoxide dehydrogenase medium subunit|tara:strand:+ start:1594 stop:2391 length:798 start_codon:yes stop_codon:yes gene_type:complete